MCDVIMDVVGVVECVDICEIGVGVQVVMFVMVGVCVDMAE